METVLFLGRRRFRLKIVTEKGFLRDTPVLSTRYKVQEDKNNFYHINTLLKREIFLRIIF